MMAVTRIFVIAFLALFLVSPTRAAPIKKGTITAWKSRCASCHGMLGKGDGPAAGEQDPRPRDFSSREWQKSVSDSDIATATRHGIPPAMPAHDDMGEEQVNNMVRLIRAMGKQ